MKHAPKLSAASKLKSSSKSNGKTPEMRDREIAALQATVDRVQGVVNNVLGVGNIGVPQPSQAPASAATGRPGIDVTSWLIIGGGALLAFYLFKR